jgi:hypothetical protein
MPIVCRKCGGNHLTIKCGSEQKKEIKKEVIENKQKYQNDKDNYKSKSSNNFRNKTVRKVNKPSYEKYSVLISNLPDDLELINLQYMMMDWGKIGNINLKYSQDKGKICYIDFYNKDHKDYFIKALDKTPVGYNIINITSI